MSTTRDVVRQEIVDSLPQHPNGRIIAAPRIGKTAIAISLIKRDKPKSILWVTPSADLAKIGIIEEFKKWKATMYIKRLTTSTYTSLSKITGHFECVILDEEQFVTQNNLNSILSGKLTYDYMFTMTGTKAKTFEKNDLYQRLNLPILYELDINSAVDLGLLANYVIKIVKIPMSYSKTMVVGNSENRFKVSEYNNYQYLDNEVEKARMTNSADIKFKLLSRMRFIYNSPSKNEALQYLKNRLKGRKMYFCSSIDQANSICKHRYHSKTDNTDLQRFIKGDIDEISMVNSGTVGFTYKSIDHLIISQVNSDSTGSTTQKICRALLKQKNYDAVIWILCLDGTKDMDWVQSTLSNFDKNRIEIIDYAKYHRS